jgi:MFS family permease
MVVDRIFFQNIGALSAYPFSPYITDHFGRKAAILLGAIIMIVATALQTASQSVHMFIGARYATTSLLCEVLFDVFRRFLIGFGLTFAAAAAPLLVTEIAYPSQRGQATSLYNTMWSVRSSLFCEVTRFTSRCDQVPGQYHV